MSARRVVVVGGGFGGLRVVRGLRHADVEVTLVDRQNYTLFQPLVYQVATGALSPAEIAVPLRSIVRRQQNARVVLAEATGFDLDQREVELDGHENITYDVLVVAGGSRYSYFGHDEWQKDAPEIKSLGGALDIRTRILSAFEAAELEADPERKRSLLTFVVVGGGPDRCRDGRTDCRARSRYRAARLSQRRYRNGARAPRRKRRPPLAHVSRIALT